MMAFISSAASRAGGSILGHWCGIVGDAVDRAIPIALAIALAVEMVSVVFGFTE